MTLPPADEFRKMRGRDLLALAADWFEAEGRRVVADIETLPAIYGPGCVGEEMRVRAQASFAVGDLIRSVNAKAQTPGARREDGVFASLLVALVRSAFSPVVEGSKDAA